MTELRFFVPGRPQTAGSKSAYVNPHTQRAVVVESGKKNVRDAKKAWRVDLRAAAERALEGADDWPGKTERELTQGFEARYVVVVKRPTAQLRTGRHAGELKEWAAGLRPTLRPDVLKLARAAEDALTGILWADDASTVGLRADKAFGDQVGLEPRAEGMIVVVREARPYAGPTVGPVAVGGA